MLNRLRNSLSLSNAIELCKSPRRGFDSATAEERERAGQEAGKKFRLRLRAEREMGRETYGLDGGDELADALEHGLGLAVDADEPVRAVGTAVGIDLDPGTGFL